jgi:hypothetical protein
MTKSKEKADTNNTKATVAYMASAVLAASFDRLCADEDDRYALQCLVGLIDKSEAIPLNTRRRLTLAIEGELATRNIAS